MYDNTLAVDHSDDILVIIDITLVAERSGDTLVMDDTTPPSQRPAGCAAVPASFPARSWSGGASSAAFAARTFANTVPGSSAASLSRLAGVGLA